MRSPFITGWCVVFVQASWLPLVRVVTLCYAGGRSTWNWLWVLTCLPFHYSLFPGLWAKVPVVLYCALILSWTVPFENIQSCCTWFKQCSHNCPCKNWQTSKERVDICSQPWFLRSLACWLPSSPLGVLGIPRPCQSLCLKKVGVTLNLNQGCVPTEDHTEPRFLKRLLLIESTSRSDCIRSTPCISFTESTWQLGNSLLHTFGPWPLEESPQSSGSQVHQAGAPFAPQHCCFMLLLIHSVVFLYHSRSKSWKCYVSWNYLVKLETSQLRVSKPYLTLQLSCRHQLHAIGTVHWIPCKKGSTASLMSLCRVFFSCHYASSWTTCHGRLMHYLETRPDLSAIGWTKRLACECRIGHSKQSIVFAATISLQNSGFGTTTIHLQIMITCLPSAGTSAPDWSFCPLSTAIFLTHLFWFWSPRSPA